MSGFLKRFLIVVATLLLSGPALAHAVLLSTEPAANAVIESGPSQLTLEFNEPVSLLTASLIAPDGTQTAIGEGATGGSRVVIDLPDALSDGTHIVSWRVVSTDGHPIGGAVPFSIRVISGDGMVETQTDPAVSGLLWASKALMYLAVAFGVGAVVFGAIVRQLPDAATALSRNLILAGLAATPISLGLQGVDALGLAATDFFSARIWSTGLSTSYGPTAIVLMLTFILALIGLAMNQKRGTTIIAALIWFGGALAFSMSGHASAANPQWLTRPAVFLHLGGIMMWVGALAPLLLLLRESSERAAAPLARFSHFIPYPVAVIVLSGVTLALIQMGGDPAQWFSPYGYIFAAKLALLAALFGLALWNRLALTGPVQAKRDGALGKLKRSIGAEMVLVVLILVLVAGWRFTPPPRALAVSASIPIVFHIHSDKAMADVTIVPGKTGSNTIALFITDGEFAPVSLMSVEVTLSAPELGIEASRLAAKLEEDGFWRVSGVSLPVAAEWQFDLEIRLTRFDMVRLTETFALP